jgi:hypothetical protein
MHPSASSSMDYFCNGAVYDNGDIRTVFLTHVWCELETSERGSEMPEQYEGAYLVGRWRTRKLEMYILQVIVVAKGSEATEIFLSLILPCISPLVSRTGSQHFRCMMLHV